MSNLGTTKMLAAYNQIATPTMFLTGMFRTPPENFHNSKYVEIDIVRSGEDVSVAITSHGQGYNMNSADIYTNKQFTPPVHKEALAISADDLLERVPGVNPFEDISFQAALTLRLLQNVKKPEQKIRRAIELQSSQVFQTGVVDLKDSSGLTRYTIDYKPKATHFPQTATSWNDAGATPLADLESLCQVIKADHLVRPKRFIFGAAALSNFLNNSKVQAILDNRRIDRGSIRPIVRGEGGTFHGDITVGDCVIEIWSYDGRFKDPETGSSLAYVDENKVIVMDHDARLDGTFGAIPRLVAPDLQIAQFLPQRLSNIEGGLDMFVNAWMDQERENMFLGVGSRPLMIPTAIDSFGCLNTVAP